MSHSNFFETLLFLTSSQNSQSEETVILEAKDIGLPSSTFKRTRGKRVLFDVSSVELMASKVLSHVENLDIQRKSEEDLAKEVREELREELREEFLEDLENLNLVNLLSQCKEKLVLLQGVSDLFVFSTSSCSEDLKSDLKELVQSLEETLERVSQ